MYKPFINTVVYPSSLLEDNKENNISVKEGHLINVSNIDFVCPTKNDKILLVSIGHKKAYVLKTDFYDCLN